MPTSSSQTCSSCGARLAKGAEVCDLCGMAVSADPDATQDASDASAAGANGTPERKASAPPAEGPYCHACGQQTPVGARFCSQCGTRLQAEAAPPPGTAPVEADLPRSTPPADDAPPPPSAEATDTNDVGRQVAFVIGGVLAVVVGLFVLTTWSQETWSGGGADGGPPAESGVTAPGASSESSASGPSLEALVARVSGDEALPSQIAAQVDSLEAAMADQRGAERQATRRELINTYVGAGQLGSAALVQKQMAEAAGTPEDWRRTGDLLYSWMETLKGQQVAVQVAEHVVQAYERVLEQQPDNLDVRTDMATAYLQTNSPMRGVKEINRVLDEDPSHFQARFNKGIMLVMIGRSDQAIEQFQKVKSIVGSESPYYQQAEQAIQTIREQEADSGSPNMP